MGMMFESQTRAGKTQRQGHTRSTSSPTSGSVKYHSQPDFNSSYDRHDVSEVEGASRPLCELLRVTQSPQASIKKVSRIACIG